VSTAEPPSPVAPDTESIVLEAQRDGRSVAVTVRYPLIREVAGLLARPDAPRSGVLCGRYGADAITLERCAEGPAAVDAIGIFRAQPGGWATVEEQDRNALRAAGIAEGIVLVLRTLVQRPWPATLFVVRAEAGAPELVLGEFAWDEYVLRKGWLLDLAPPPPPPPRPQPAARPKRRHGGRWTILALLLLAGCGAVAWRWLPFHWTPAAPAERPAHTNSAAQPVALRVSQAPGELDISWNHDADAIRQARAGTLTIRNGTATRILALRPAQLREGRVVYHPLPGVDTEVRLEVLDVSGKSQAESLQMLALDPPGAVTDPLAPAPPAMPQPGSASRTAPQLADAEDARDEEPPRATVTLARATRQDTRAEVRPARAAQIERTGRLEAVPIRRASPELRPEVLRELRAATGKVTVSVLVSIGPSGSVDDAQVESSTGEPSFNGPYIRLAALNAARQWRFRPAIANGRPVPSKMTLTFPF